MVEPDRFWQSDIPFISDVEGKRVDWTDVGLTALATLATSYFTTLAELVETLWAAAVIIPSHYVSIQYHRLVDTISGVSGSLDFGPAISVAQETGLIGSLVIVALGAYIVSVAIEVIR